MGLLSVLGNLKDLSPLRSWEDTLLVKAEEHNMIRPFFTSERLCYIYIYIYIYIASRIFMVVYLPCSPFLRPKGTFPTENTARDGYAFQSPVDAFPPQNDLGLYDMIGEPARVYRFPVHRLFILIG